MTIKVEKALGGQDWIVRLDDYPVKFRSMLEAVEFAGAGQTGVTITIKKSL